MRGQDRASIVGEDEGDEAHGILGRARFDQRSDLVRRRCVDGIGDLHFLDVRRGLDVGPVHQAGIELAGTVFKIPVSIEIGVPGPVVRSRDVGAGQFRNGVDEMLENIETGDRRRIEKFSDRVITYSLRKKKRQHA